MDKTTSRELSEELKEFGTKQGLSEKVWIIAGRQDPRVVHVKVAINTKCVIVCDAYDCFELLKMLFKFCSIYVAKTIGNYHAEFPGGYGCSGETIPEALGNLLLRRLKKEHCKE